MKTPINRKLSAMPKKPVQSGKGTRTKQPAKRSSLRIQLKGKRTPHDLRKMLHQAVDEIETLAIMQMTSINLYITPLDEDGNHCTPRRDGRSITQLSIKEPYISAASEHGL
ncbi:MAG: hypothetical protein V7731_01175 [Amphritea sp.]